MVPVEIGKPSYRTKDFDIQQNEEGLREKKIVDLLDEVREQARITGLKGGLCPGRKEVAFPFRLLPITEVPHSICCWACW